MSIKIFLLLLLISLYAKEQYIIGLLPPTNDEATNVEKKEGNICVMDKPLNKYRNIQFKVPSSIQ